jgi:protein-S-isoprenylcysteine O-methyltransferase Ste14
MRMVLFLKILVFTVLVPATVVGYIPWSLVRDIPYGLTPWSIPAAICSVAGVAIYLWCAYDFGVAGRGTPAPIDAPKHLVVRGLYRYVRNPMYVGVMLVLAGWNILYRTESLMKYTIGAFVFLNLLVFFYEEPHLLRLFGKEYSAYRSRVGRWLPGIGRKTSLT